MLNRPLFSLHTTSPKELEIILNEINKLRSGLEEAIAEITIELEDKIETNDKNTKETFQEIDNKLETTKNSITSISQSLDELEASVKKLIEDNQESIGEDLVLLKAALEELDERLTLLVNNSEENFVKISDERLTDSREWLADTVPLAEAREGKSKIRRAWTSELVREAVLAALPTTATRWPTPSEVGLGNIPNSTTIARNLDSSNTLILAKSMFDHISSSDHDSRYYRKSEVNTSINTLKESLESQISTLSNDTASQINSSETRSNQYTDTIYKRATDEIIKTNILIAGTEEEAQLLRGEDESFQEVFENWERFSHLRGRRPASVEDLNGWVYEEENNRLVSTLNSPTTVGFISPNKYENFVFDVVVNSSNNDDDLIGLVVAYAEDAQGRGNAIYAFRTPGGIGHNADAFISGRRWLFHVGLNLSDRYSTMPQLDLGSNNNGLIWGDNKTVNAERDVRSDVGRWSEYGEVRIRVERVGDNIKVQTTNPNSMEFVDEATVEFSLADHPELSIFRGGSRIGYTQHSQQDSTFRTLQRPSDQLNVVDMSNGLLWTNEGLGWTSTPLPKNTFVPERFYLNADQDRVYFADSEGNIKEVTSPAAKELEGLISHNTANDTVEMHLPVVAENGIRTNSIKIGDGNLVWDEVSNTLIFVAD